MLAFFLIRKFDFYFLKYYLKILPFALKKKLCLKAYQNKKISTIKLIVEKTSNAYFQKIREEQQKKRFVAKQKGRHHFKI